MIYIEVLAENWYSFHVSTWHFNSLGYAKRLKEAGFNEQQAEVLAEQQVKTLETNLVTKRDLEKFRGDMDKFKGEVNDSFKEVFHRFELTDAKIDSKIDSMRAEMLKWFIGISFTQAAFIVALIKLL